MSITDNADIEDSTYDILFYTICGGLCLQLLIYLTLQVLQLRKVKGAIRMYLLFEFLSIICLNTTTIFYVLEHRRASAFLLLKNIPSSSPLLKEIPLDMIQDNPYKHATNSELVLEVKTVFLALRNGFVALIAYDAYYIVCKPFEFRDFVRLSQLLKRCVVLVACCFLFHGCHLVRMVSYILVNVHLSKFRSVVLWIQAAAFEGVALGLNIIYDSGSQIQGSRLSLSFSLRKKNLLLFECAT